MFNNNSINYNNGDMLRPTNWDELQLHSEKRPPAGIYIMRIINATVGKTKNGDRILRLELDIAEGEYKNYYTDISTSYNRNLLLKHGQLCEKDSSMGFFKKVITDIEKSNLGYTFDFNCNSLRGKLIGAYTIYEEYEKNGQLRSAMKIANFLSVGEAREMTAKKLSVPDENEDIKQKMDEAYDRWKNKQTLEPQPDDLPFN